MAIIWTFSIKYLYYNSNINKQLCQLKPIVLIQVSNKFHKFQQTTTKQGKEMYNVRQTGINTNYKYPMFCK